ncbi:MAG: hypothetical protein IRZ07_11615 [Microbispora sp.]|nr:hypothetical protein [Microbispora sp.]
MDDSRAGSSRVVTAPARRLAIAAILVAVPGVGISVAAVPPALAMPVPAVGHALHGQSALGTHIPTGKGTKGLKGKKGPKAKKGPKGKKGKGPGGGARIGARLAGFGGGFGDGDDGGGGMQYTTGMNTANAPTISSPPYQAATGRRNVNAPAGNSAVDFAGVQQVSSVSVFTDSLSGNCQSGIDTCSINQQLRANESRGGSIGH